MLGGDRITSQMLDAWNSEVSGTFNCTSPKFNLRGFWQNRCFAARTCMSFFALRCCSFTLRGLGWLEARLSSSEVGKKNVTRGESSVEERLGGVQGGSSSNSGIDSIFGGVEITNAFCLRSCFEVGMEWW